MLEADNLPLLKIQSALSIYIYPYPDTYTCIIKNKMWLGELVDKTSHCGESSHWISHTHSNMHTAAGREVSNGTSQACQMRIILIKSQWQFWGGSHDWWLGSAAGHITAVHSIFTPLSLCLPPRSHFFSCSYLSICFVSPCAHLTL